MVGDAGGEIARSDEAADDADDAAAAAAPAPEIAEASSSCWSIRSLRNRARVRSNEKTCDSAALIDMMVVELLSCLCVCSYSWNDSKRLGRNQQQGELQYALRSANESQRVPRTARGNEKVFDLPCCLASTC
jgi:hypothetical protein